MFFELVLKVGGVLCGTAEYDPPAGMWTVKQAASTVTGTGASLELALTDLAANVAATERMLRERK